MSTLKELTAYSHARAENTPFMRLFMAKALTEEEYMEYITQLSVIYTALEFAAEKVGILQELDGIHHQIQTGKTVLPLLSQVKQVALNINLSQLSQISLSEILSKKMQRIEIRSLCIGAVLSNDELSSNIFFPFHFSCKVPVSLRKTLCIRAYKLCRSFFLIDHRGLNI
jgi:hypothetical protein